MIVDVVDVVHEPAERELAQGFKLGQKTRMIAGKLFRARTAGWGEHTKPGKLFAVIRQNNETFRLRIDPYFRERLSNGTVAKLTQKRVALIINNKPDRASINFCDGRWQLAEKDLNEWFNRAFG